MTIRVDFSSIPEPLEEFPWDKILLQDEYWMDRYGTKHKIEEMDTDYIENCIPFAIGGMAQVLSSLFWAIDDGNPLALHGDMSRYSIERLIRQYSEAPLITALKQELATRKALEGINQTCLCTFDEYLDGHRHRCPFHKPCSDCEED